MRPTNPKRFLRSWVLVLLLLSGVSCSTVKVVTESPAPPAVVTPTAVVVTPPAVNHDIAITAIKFDPASGSGGSSSQTPGSLLAVLENKGNQGEKDITLEATLYGPEEGDLLLRRSARVQTLVPGESSVVSFGELPLLPLRSSYRLIIEAKPVPGEVLISDNRKTYELQVTLSVR